MQLKNKMRIIFKFFYAVLAVFILIHIFSINIQITLWLNTVNPRFTPVCNLCKPFYQKIKKLRL